MFRHRIPLARRNLTHNWRRLAAALCGVGFAVVLMFTEMGFVNALFDSTVKVIDDLNADLILSSAAHLTLLSGETFARERAVQAAGCPGVRAVHPLYVDLAGEWKGPDRIGHGIRVLACDVSQPVFNLPEVRRRAAALEEPGTALFDLRGKLEKYGMPHSAGAALQLSGTELNGQAVRVVGTFEMGTTFSSDGNVLVSQRNLARFCPQRDPDDPLNAVSAGVVQLQEGASVPVVQTALAKMLSPDVRVWTKTEFMDQEKRFLNSNTGIGFVFALGMWLGFAVGVIICYQIINADVSDHLSEFATLKAMGYRNRYFIGLVMQEAAYLSLLAFVPGVLVSLGLYHVLAGTTGLLMELNLSRTVTVLVWTTAMCAVSGGLAMRKVFAADPADLY